MAKSEAYCAPKRKLHRKSILSFLFSKLVIVGLLIVFQVLFLFAALVFLNDYFVYTFGFLMLLSMCIVIWLVGKDENPSYKLAWVIPIIIFPIFGGLFYLVFGNKNMPKKLVDRIRAAEKSERRAFSPEKPYNDELRLRSPQLATIADYITRTTGAPLWKNTRCEYLPIGEAMWASMLEELPKAKKFIFMEYFILEPGKMWEPILDILKDKAVQGVDVRFMYDDMGSIMTLPYHYAEKLRSYGIKCVKFNPFQPHLNSMMNYRDHRKIAVIDGNVGYCGGINIADEYINAYCKHGHWKDTGVRLEGDGVWNLTSMFLSLWNFGSSFDTEFEQFRPTTHLICDSFVQPFGDSPLDRVSVSEDVYMHIINRATEYVYITTPYLILDNEMVTALQSAARSGIDVRIVTPHIADKWIVHQATQSFYQPLLTAGVRIFEYTPGFVHAKMYVCDDRVAVVGTANMDYRSFYLHFECGVCIYEDAPVIRAVRDDILATFDQSFEIPRDYQKSVKLWKRILRAFLRLFSPMM